MLYYLFRYLEKIDIPGASLFNYISFRAAMAIVLALFLAAIFGKRAIAFLKKKQIGEDIRNLGLEGQLKKKGTPTMGGIIILYSILIPVLLFTRLDNIYIILLIITTIWMGFVGFVDDYIKVFKKNKTGLEGKFKLIGQVVLAIIVSSILFFNEDVVIRENIQKVENHQAIKKVNSTSANDVKSTKTTIPFFKNNEFDYAILVSFLKHPKSWIIWLIFTIFIVLIVTSVSNAANITDGLDGLSSGISAIIGVTLGIFAYVSGHVGLADYLNIMYIPNSGELVVFIAAYTGAIIGFLWYNSYPAQVFMGDVGSITLGAIIAVFAISIRKELLIPLLCGVFLVENLSVVLQVSYFKYTKRKFGVGRRIFKMSPLHHHYQKLNIPESKIVTRFWIVSILLAVLSILTLKIR